MSSELLFSKRFRYDVYRISAMERDHFLNDGGITILLVANLVMITIKGFKIWLYMRLCQRIRKWNMISLIIIKVEKTTDEDHENNLRHKPMLII